MVDKKIPNVNIDKSKAFSNWSPAGGAYVYSTRTGHHI